MLDKLNIVQQRYNEVSDLIIQPNIITCLLYTSDAADE